MAEQRQPFRFRIPWLPGASVPARAPAELTQRPVTEAPAAAERIPFQLMARPPFRPAGIAQVPPPPPPLKIPTPPRRVQQPPSPPRTAPQSSLPLWPITQPEVPSAVVSQVQSPSGAPPEGHLKSDGAGSIHEMAQPKDTLLPSVSVPQSSDEKLVKPVDSASHSDPVKAEPPKSLPSSPTETSLLAPVSQPSTDLQLSRTSLPEPAEQLVADKKPTEPLAPALIPNLAKSDPPEPTSRELRPLSLPLPEESSPTAVAQPSQPKETSLPESFVQQVEDEKPMKPTDSASVPILAAANPPEPTPLVPKVLPLALQERPLFSAITRPSGESQGPLSGIFSKLQENKRVEAPDQKEAPSEAAGSVENSGKAKVIEMTHPPALPPVPEKQLKGPLPSASASQEPKRSKQMKTVPRRRVVTSSSHQSNTSHLNSRPRPAAVRGSGSSSSSSSFQKEIKDDVSKLVHSMTSGKANTSKMQYSVEVITLAGENTGATMQLTLRSSEKKEHIHIRKNDTADVEEDEDEEEETAVDGEAGEEESENAAFLNSNVQGMNNSIVLDSSVSEGSPGVYFELALNDELQLESRSESHKDEYGVTPAEKHVYKPTIRRRCLRGLLKESSNDDSSNDDADNTSKPWRHGCRFSSEQENEEHIDIE